MRRRDALTGGALAAYVLAAQRATGQDDEQRWEIRRVAMVRDQIKARGVRDLAVLDAMQSVPRHRFIPAEVRGSAYIDSPLPIGFDQTISQPYIVARMTELLEVEGHHRVLEIGTGSGYQAAVLASLSDQVFSVEIVPELAKSAAETLRSLGFRHVRLRTGDGYEGWPEYAPFDRIMVTAAPPELPEALVDQMAPGGRLLAPVGRTSETQRLVLVTKDAEGRVRRRPGLAVRFVPMVRSESAR